MKKLLLALCLMAPTVSMASTLLVPGAYQGDEVTVLVSPASRGAQSINIVQKDTKTVTAQLSVNSFSIDKTCTTEMSSVTEMGYLIVAKCSPSGKKLITWTLDQENGVLKAIHIRHDKAGLFGGGYKQTYGKSFLDLQRK